MAISTADFRNGMCIEYNGKLCTIVEFQHVKPGKGGAFGQESPVFSVHPSIIFI